MSGPKTSRYTLTPEQRRIMERQREMDRRKAVAAESIQRNAKRLSQIGSMFSSEKQVSAELMHRVGDDGGFTQKVNELEMLIASIGPAVAGTDKNDVLALERTSGTVSECAAKAEQMVRELSNIAALNEVKLQTHLNAAIDQGFAASFEEVKSADAISTADVRDKMRVQLLQMKKNDTLPVEWLEEIGNAISGTNEIQDEVFIKNYLALMVSPLIKKCTRFLAEYEECHEEFEKLYAEYAALCQLYCYTLQECSCTAASVDFLKAEIQRMKETAMKEDEQAYISDCLDEVMEEMGYTVLGRREVTKKNGKHFRNKLYTYGEGTAVNVTCSPDGKVAMELGGLDVADRLPDGGEAALLCESMESFCEDFKEIEKRLLAKGVILADRISLLPPSAEYAQIINTSDYAMEAETEKFKGKKQHKNVAKLKQRCETNGKV